MKPICKACLFACAAFAAFPGIALADELPPPADQTDYDPGIWRISTGVNYSEGDYGDIEDTRVVTVPVAIKYRRGGFSVRVSVPYVHIEGPGSLIDAPQGRDGGFADGGGSGGSGSNSGSGSSNSGSGSSNSGSGSSNSGSGSSGSGSSGSGSSGSGSSGSSGSGTSGTSGSGILPGGTSNQRDGIGDVAVTIGYSLGLADTTFLDLSGRVKLPTASTADRLGTGEVDFTLGADLVQDVGNASFYVGGRRKFVGKPTGSLLRDVWGFGGGMSYAMPGGTIVGADYDWQQGSIAANGPSSEVTGWINFGLTRRIRMQVFASTGFTQDSADFAAGLSLSFRLN